MMSRIGTMVVQEEEEEEELGPMIIRRRTTWAMHGIHQSLHPAVRHGELPSAKGVMATSLSLKPKIGKRRGTRAWSLPLS